MLNLKSFELMDQVVFSVSTDYKVDDQNGKDVQCTYIVLKDAFTEQVYNKMSTSKSADEEFFASLGTSNEGAARAAVYQLCGQAQDSVENV